MTGKIPQSFIDTLLARVDIIDVISQYVQLKKKGANHQACCPFHQEKTPSFTVSQSKQFYYCFGCGAHGNALGFLMNHERLEFIDAVEELAKRVGMEVVHEQRSEREIPMAQQRSLYEYLAAAQRFFQWQLKHHSEGKTAIAYLQQRGLTGKTAQQFALGFAPSGWDELTNALGKTEVDRRALLEAGLLVKNDSQRMYDRFRDRIMFPIRDSRGRTIGFGGRVMSKDQQPKYLNSPETPVFHKGQALYGIFEAKQQLTNPTQLLIVEGYMDVIALAQNGIHYALATLGTATTSYHLRMLLRYCDHLIFCFDGDNAGREAAWRALKAALPIMNGEYRVRFLFLPEGEDPDSLVQKEGKAAFEQRLTHAISLTDFLLTHTLTDLDITTLEGKAKLLTVLQPYLQLIPEGPYAALLRGELGRMTQLSEAKLQKAFRDSTIPDRVTQESRLSLVEQAMAHILQYPEIALEMPHPQLPESSTDYILLNRLVHFIQTHRFQHAGVLLQQWEDPDTAARLAYLATIEHPAHQGDIQLELRGIFKKLAEQGQGFLVDTLIAKSKSTGLSIAEKKILADLLKQNKK